MCAVNSCIIYVVKICYIYVSLAYSCLNFEQQYSLIEIFLSKKGKEFQFRKTVKVW